MPGLYAECGKYPYTAWTGRQAHNLVFEWLSVLYPERRLMYDRPLNVIGLGVSMIRPDVVDKEAKLVWEIKPITHKGDAFYAADEAQLKKYMDEGKLSRGEVTPK
jgi:hypothetical protein